MRAALQGRGVSDACFDLLQARLAALVPLSSPAASPSDDLTLPAVLCPSGLARAALDALGTEWDDGDEAFVRERLDAWSRDETVADVATRLLAAADTLAKTQVRPATLIFFLWELESVLEGLSAERRDSR